ncbi:hypothetical protein ACJJTC_003403 [Scirpophaga incertulas]
MMIRRATALCTEQKLRQALEELKHTKETCSQLLRERDESEIEIQKIIERNTQLKSELSQLHAQHVDVLQNQENLNETISCYDQQYSTYERTLQRITDLEKELSVANNQISHYKELEQLQETVHTENLYQELVESPGGLSMLYQQPLSTNKDNCDSIALEAKAECVSAGPSKAYIVPTQWAAACSQGPPSPQPYLCIWRIRAARATRQVFALRKQ